MAEGIELGKAYVQIIPSARGIGAKLREALGDEPGKAGDAAGQSMGGRMMAAVKRAIAAAGIGAAFSKALTEGASLQQSLGGVETLFKDSADVVRQYAANAYKTSGVSANQYMEQITSFSATLLQGLGGDTAAAAEYGNQAMEQMSDNVNKFGSDAASVQMAYQGFAKDNYTLLDNLKLGYGGTQAEMARLINDSGVLGDAIEVTAETVKDVPFHKIIEAIGVIQDELGITGTTASEAATTISGSFTAMKAALSNVLGGLTLGEDITPALEGLAETAAAYLFDNLLPAIGNIIRGLPEAIGTFFREAAPRVREEITGGLEEAFPSLSGHVDELLAGLSSLAAGFAVFHTLSGIAAKLTPVITGITTLTTSMKGAGSVLGAVKVVVAALGGPVTLIIAGVAALTAGFLYLWNTCEPFKQFWIDLGTGIANFVQNAVQAVVNFFTVTIPTTVQNAVTFLQGIPGAVSEFFQQLPYNIGHFLGEALGNLVSWAMQLPVLARQAAGDFLSNVVDFFQQLPGNILRWITEALSNISQWAIDLGKKGLEAAGELLDNVVNGVKELPDKLLSIGQNAIEGLWNGIQGAKDWLVGKISGFVSGIVDGFKSAFKIGSPSRVMADKIGHWIAPGIAQGITGNMDPLQKAMRDVSDLVASPLDKTITLGLRTSMPRGTPALAGAGAAGGTTNFYQTIHTHDALSPAELTREAENLFARARWKNP